MNTIVISLFDTILENFIKIVVVLILSFLMFILVNHVIQMNKYQKFKNEISFRDVAKKFTFSIMELVITYQDKNNTYNNYNNYIKLNFDIERKNEVDNSFIISLSTRDNAFNHMLLLEKNSTFKNIKLQEIKNYKYASQDINEYTFIFKKGEMIGHLSLNIEGNIFGGNDYSKEFLLDFSIEDSSHSLKKINIKPILNAVDNVSLIDHSKLFDIEKDNPYYRIGKIVSADKLHNLFFRFIDLQKQGEYQTKVIMYSTIFGVLLSILINLLFTLSKSFLLIYKRNN